MFIVMHSMGMPFDGNTIKERSLGGSETAAIYMAEELAKLGHRVSVFTSTRELTVVNDVRYVPHGNITQLCPLGEAFHDYAHNTPHDVLIIQRHAQAFAYQWASKINLWWVHDLALKRHANSVQSMLWNITGILTVSEWHKEQVQKVYGINPEIIFPITNGVDLSLYEGELQYVEENGIKAPARVTLNQKTNQFKMLYSSRPERGLEFLVQPDGIMHQLLEARPEAHLYVCGYDNTVPAMADYYYTLWQACEALPNVTNLGALTKQELADVQRQMDIHIYPSAFEETSCITAMECMAANLPMLATKIGAIPETTLGSGTLLIDPEVDDLVPQFVAAVKSMTPELLEPAIHNQRMVRNRYSWEKAAERLFKVIEDRFAINNLRVGAKAKELLKNSDYYALEYLFSKTDLNRVDDKILLDVKAEIDECYAFTKEAVWDEHYRKYYQYEKDRGVEYGPEQLDGNSRFEVVAGYVASLPSGSIILDYGCAHGHYTINLAKRNPDKRFIGVDITVSNIEAARKWARDEKLSNVHFGVGEYSRDEVLTYLKQDNEFGGEAITIQDGSLTCYIAAEVLEHLHDPGACVDYLNKLLMPTGKAIITTPYGGWENIGAKDHWPWRAHVHHFEREDLHNLWGHFPEFHIITAPAGRDKYDDAMGSYITTFATEGFDEPKIVSGTIDYDRKLFQMNPRGTISCCMIVGNEESVIRRSLENSMPYCDELIINFDPKINDNTKQVVIDYMAKYWPEKHFSMRSDIDPLVAGFDEARNSTLERASGDWILWLDSDEFLHNGRLMYNYVKNNHYEGYAIAQHHFTLEPVGVQKTDLPVRLFRNHKGIKFFGVVHEHPEKDLNKGVGYVTAAGGISIAHEGYTDEAVRRKRFQRNIDLMVRDREKYPTRKLGKFLWIRDLSLMCGFDYERGSQINELMRQRARRGIELFEELLEDSSDTRMLVDAVEFYSNLCHILGGGFEFALKIDTNVLGSTHIDEIRPVVGYFHNKEHVHKLTDNIINERTKDYETKYL